ncbi:MAG: sigma 54-interacting transcriptional regulator [Myxococcota bacterium]|nr:sigma 54-interacting transcriptional regulator [Myxococcota bacterium]
MADASLRVLRDLADVTSGGGDLDKVAPRFLEALSDGGFARPCLMLADAVRMEVAVVASHGPTDRRARLAFGEGVAGRVAVSDAPTIIPRIGDDSRLDPGGRPDRARIFVPVRWRRRVLGVLVADRDPAPPASLASAQALLQVAAALVAPAMAERVAAKGAAVGRSGSAAGVGPMVGSSKGMRRVVGLVEQVGPSDTTVLLRGESGTGKELVADAVQRASGRSRAPFIKVNCAALPDTIIESELFGHERGAFTGAVQQRKGRFELAHGGTLFLDEIGDLSAQTQIKLLRVLQQRTFERVGGNRTVSVDVRVIAATSRDLEAMMAEGTFRADLYYRLNVFPIHLPPLRERKADILLLADHFVERFNRRHGRAVRRISTGAIDLLVAYHWPGNVRELENNIERAVLVAQDDVLHGHHLPPTLQTAESSGTVSEEGLAAQLDALEHDLIVDALKSARGNMARAARRLGITERIMGLRVRKHRIEARRFKPRR